MKEYLNMEKLYSEIVSLYKDCRDRMADDDNRDFLSCEFDDDTIEELAWYLTLRINKEMKEYLNSNLYEIYGNFKDLGYDYTSHITGKYEYDRELVSNMVERLNRGEQSEQADADREFLLEWFFFTFGTWGIRYNFESFISEILYEYEKEVCEI